MTENNNNDLVQLLLKRQGELNSLLEITQAITRNSAASALFEMLGVILKVHTKVGRMRLLIRDSAHFYCAARFGGAFENSRGLNNMCHLLQEERAIRQLDDHPDAAVREYNYFIPVVHKNDLKAFMLVGGIDASTELINSDLDFIQTLINVIVVALDNKKLFRERMKRERMQRDMELASEVQNMLIPLNLPNTNKIQVGSLYLPNLNIGGDYFDFIRTAEHEFTWCIADVTGKGMSAALLMANLQASLRAWVSVEKDLTQIILKLNNFVVQNTKGERFITLFIGQYNEETREMHYINAGHNPPVLLMNGSTYPLKKGTTIIGAFEELPFIHTETLTLAPGSLIFNYTDGLIESADENVFVTDEVLLDLLIQNKDLPVDDLNKRILWKIQSMHRAKMNSDDITMLSIRVV